MNVSNVMMREPPVTTSAGAGRPDPPPAKAMTTSTDDGPETAGPTAHRQRPSIGSVAAAPNFEALFRTEFPVMFRLAHLLGAADPEDVAQEAFLRLHARWDHLADRSGAGGYLRATVVNLVRTAGRRSAVKRRQERPDLRPELLPSAESTALERVSDEAMLAALHGLTARHREALVLRFWLDLSERQMADAMNTSVGTVKSHVSRGLSALRTQLAAGSRGGGMGTPATGGEAR